MRLEFEEMWNIHKEGIRLGFKREYQDQGVGVEGVHRQDDVLPEAGSEAYNHHSLGRSGLDRDTAGNTRIME